MMVSNPKPTKRPIMRELFQAYWEPPHWRASRRQMTVGMRIRVPMMSSWRILCNTVWFLGLFSRLICKMNKTSAMTTPPMGRLKCFC